jgi:hypothetical protein
VERRVKMKEQTDAMGRALESDTAARDGSLDEVLGLLMLRQSVVSRTDRATAEYSMYERSRDSAVAEIHYRFAALEAGKAVDEKCGQGIQFGRFIMGCGRTLDTPRETYRCYDCDVAFHKNCLKQHCTERKHGEK